jgi:pimeloyl-ACP methyl ester carboxylesterase
MRWFPFLVMLMCAACSAEKSSFRGAQSPLAYDVAAVSRADRIAILIPGALASVDIFAPAQKWKASGYAIVTYRFPGMDGLPLDHRLGIEDAAAQIAAFTAGHPGKAYRLLGYSTGGPIAISAAGRIAGDVKVAAMSSAVERAGGTATALRSSFDVLAAAARAGSVDREVVWLEYYRTLLFGRAGLKNPDLRAQASTIVAKERSRIVIPEGELLAAHSEDLRGWRLPPAPRLPADRLRFFIGQEDPVFSDAQTAAFARAFGAPGIARYPAQGHLLFLTRPEVFDDVLAFFEAE